jgi:Xaa-Pro aminopeptidase
VAASSENSGQWARRNRAIELARKAGADALVAAHVSTVAWLTGFEASIASGPSPWAHTPVAFLEAGRPPVLIIGEDDVDRTADLACEIVSYPGIGIEKPDPLGHVARILTRITDGRTVATEPGALPLTLGALVSWLDISTGLASLRAPKDPDEVDKIRSAIRITDIGQQTIREHATEALTEIELYANAVRSMEVAAGEPLPILAELVSGVSLKRWWGSPTSKTIDATHYETSGSSGSQQKTARRRKRRKITNNDDSRKCSSGGVFTKTCRSRNRGRRDS